VISASAAGYGIAPRVVAATQAGSSTFVLVFSEAMSTAGLTTAGNYALTANGGSTVRTITGVELRSLTSVTITCSGNLSTGTAAYTVTAAGLLDRAGNALDTAADTADLTVVAGGSMALFGANGASAVAVAVRIEGVGDVDGQWSFCVEAPAYGDASWKPWLVTLPTFLSERVDMSGGVPQAGSCSVELLDAGDALTSLLRTESEAYTVLDEAVDLTETSIEVARNTSLDGKVIWVGSEAMLVTGVASSPTRITVQRAYLGTEATTHAVDDPLYLYLNYLEGRRFSVVLADLDATSSAGEVLLGTYLLESVRWSSALNAWDLRGTSQQRYLDRQAALQRRRAKVMHAGERGLAFDRFSLQALWSDKAMYARVEDEILQLHDDGAGTARPASINMTPVYGYRARGVHNSKQGEPAEGQEAEQVFLAGRDMRYSPGPSPSTSRSSGTWTAATHWVDLLLILLLSSAEEADGLELTNRRTTGSDWSRSNFASLPPGYGAGIPASLIDWSSWEDVRGRTAAYTLPLYVHAPADPQSFADLLGKQFLQPMGAYLAFEQGSFRLQLSRVPLSISTPDLTLDETVILRRMDGAHQAVPELEVSRERLDGVGSVVYQLGPQAISAVYRNSDWGRTYGQRGWYGAQEPSLTIAVPGALPGDAELWGQRAAARLFRHHRPAVTLSMACDASVLEDATVGAIADVSLAELPDVAAGSRTWTEVPCEIVEREVRAEPQRSRDGGTGAGISVQLVARRYATSLRVGRLCPAAHVTSVAGNVATVHENRYTVDDAALGLPTDDGTSFAVGDLVILCARDGEPFSAATQEVTARTATTITLDGDFSGGLQSGRILTYAAADDSTPGQLEEFVHLADAGGQTIGTGDQTPWKWGEP
jgi:hypothetical protein